MDGEFGLGFIELVVFAERGVVGDAGVERLAGCERRFESGALRVRFGGSENSCLAIEKLSALPGLASDHDEL